ncbi:MAG: PRC-barrel domain-containing protein [Candidatus Acidiferrales bacterium]
MSIGARQSPDAYTIIAKKSLIGTKVINTAREDLGSIDDLAIDASTGRVAYAILSFGGWLGMGNKYFAIPWEALNFNPSEKAVVLSVEKERLKNAPGFDKDDWPNMSDRAWGSQLYSYYGYRPYWENEGIPRTSR